MRRFGKMLYVLICLMLWGVAAAPQEAGMRQARIVWPQPGAALYLNGTIEVELAGLTVDDFRFLEASVRTRRWPSGDPVGEPIVLWEGSAVVPVAPGGSLSDGRCAWVSWIDQTAGRALLSLVWNHFEPGFRTGDYEIQVEIRLRSSGLGSLWGRTDWYRLRLVPERAPLLAVSLIRPFQETEYWIGDTITIAGAVSIPVLPVRVRLEIMDTGVGRWEMVAAHTVSAGGFEIPWKAMQVALGSYKIRVLVTDGRGAAGSSDVVQIRFVSRGMRVQVQQPVSDVVLTVGQRLTMLGQVLGAALPGRIRAEISREEEPGRWNVVGELSLTSTNFALDWDTSAVRPGVVYLRITAWDSQGASSASDPVRIVFREKLFRILVNGQFGEQFETSEGEPVQFELETEEEITKISWAFGDGGTSGERAVVHAFGKPGSYKVTVVGQAPGQPPRQASVLMVVKAREGVVATRVILGYPRPNCDGVAALVYQPKEMPRGTPGSHPVRVEIKVRIVEPVSGLVITEVVPAGWKAEPDENLSSGAKVQFIRRGQELSWVVTAMGPQLELRPGFQMTISYVLYPPVTAAPLSVGIDGKVYVQLGPDLTVQRKVGGESRVTVESKLHPWVALLYLRKEAEGRYMLNPPWTVREFVLTADQLQLAEEFMLNSIPVPYADVTLAAEDYLKLVALYLAGRPIMNCSATK